MKINEKLEYYWVYPKKENQKIRYVKKYKPSFAKLIQSRTGWKMEKI